MARFLSETQRRQYREDGIVFPLTVLSAEEVREFRGACDRLEAELGGKPRTIEVRQMHLHFPWASRLATHPRILDAVEDILGPDLLVWATELFAKHPEDKTVSIGWHRDRPYMGFDVRMTTTAWIALSDSTPANGCVRAVPRRGAPMSQDESRTVTVDEASAVDVVLRAGEMSLHDVDVAHGSGPNRGRDKRVGFAVRYLTPEARPRHGRPPVLLARGQVRHDHFDVIEPPTETEPGQALAAMKASAAHHLEAMLLNLRGKER